MFVGGSDIEYVILNSRGTLQVVIKNSKEEAHPLILKINFLYTMKVLIVVIRKIKNYSK